MKRSLIAACLLLAGAGPATLPADVATLQTRLETANARIAELEGELAALRATPATQPAVAAAPPQSVVVVTQIHDDGTALSLKRNAAKNVRVGMSPESVVTVLGEPKEKRRDGARDVYVYKRADLGHQGHGTFTPGPKYTLTLTFDTDDKLEVIDGADR